MNYKLHLILIMFLLCPLLSFAQGHNVNGLVKDAGGMGIPGASVIEKGTMNGTVTDIDGKFQLSVQNPNCTLSFSCIGYSSLEISVEGKSTINIVLSEDSELLEEIVVTGYGGVQKRGNLTTAISKMDNAVLEKAAFSNVAQSLQGNVTGLRVTNVTGQPGSAPKITLRGGATITGASNDALVIVDGIIRSMDSVNPSDIESVQVLKDAASTAIYGARANGGVILIETKSGKSGKPQISYKFKLGSNLAREGYQFLSTEEYIRFNRIGYIRAKRSTSVDTQNGYGVTGNKLYDIKYLTDETKHLQNEGWQVMKDPVSDKQIIFKDYAGVIDADVFDNSALSQDHHLSISGGTDKLTYASSLGYYSEDGQIVGTGFRRFNGSFNASYQALPFLKIKAGATIALSTKPSLWTSETAVFYRVRSQRPTWNPYLTDGSPASGAGPNDGNPAYWRSKYIRENNTRTSTFNAGFKADIIPQKLFLTGDASLYYLDYQEENFNKAFQNQTSAKPNTVREASAGIRKDSQMQLNATLTYTDVFAEKHNLEAMLGGEYFDYGRFVFTATTQKSPTDDITTLNVGADRTATSTSKTAHRILSTFGRLNYNYDSKYLLSLVYRYDGISRLKDHRWGFFPGISVGWNITKEDFWKNSSAADVITTLKPRLSYGVNGNVTGLGDYIVYGAYSGTTNYNGEAAYYNSALLNTGLRWEQSKTFEAGLDISFLKDRVYIILDYYNRSTSNLLTSLALPNYTGFSSILTNLGDLRNSGVEFEIKAHIINHKDFTWDMSANLTSVSNKILRLPYNGNEFNRVGGYEVAVGPGIKNPDGTYASKWVGGYQEGGRLGEIVAYQQHHIFRDWNDVKQNANMLIDEVANLYGPGRAAEYEGKPGWKPIEPGDVCWEDMNGDGIINKLDQHVIGNIFPTVTGGFTTTFGYKGISLNARFDYALGHTIFNHLRAASIGQYQGQFNIITDVYNMWSEENPDSDLPAFYYADQLSKKNITRGNNAGTAINGNSSRFYERADYLALRELTLNWNLPSKWTSKAFMKGASIYVTGQNLLYITKYSGTSPEPAISNSGVDNGRYPIPRTVLLGLSLNF